LRVGVNFLDVENFPTFETVTALAIIAHFCLMHIGVTTRAFGSDVGKIFDVVARFAGHGFVAIFQRKIGAAVVEAHVCPFRRAMTDLTI
jgi:hypothetical protein